MFKQKELTGQNNIVYFTKSGIKPAFGGRRLHVLQNPFYEKIISIYI